MLVLGVMEIIGEDILAECIERYPDSEKAIRRWVGRVRMLRWRTPLDSRFASSQVRILGGRRLLFDIMENRYRIVTSVDYQAGIVQVLFAGPHSRYDRIKARTV